MRLVPTSITVAPGLTQSALTSSRRPDRGDEDVGSAADLGQVARARVADRDRRVGAQQQRRQRPADQDRAADDHRLGPLELGVPRARAGASRPAECTGPGPGRPWASSPALVAVRPSTSLAGSIAAITCVGVDLVGHRQLDEDAVDTAVVVQLGDQLEQLVLRRRARRDRGGSSACRPPRRPGSCSRCRPARRGRRRPGPSPGRACARARRRTPRPRRRPPRGPRRRPPCRRSPRPPRSARLAKRRVVGHQLALAAAAARSGRRSPTPGSTEVTTPSPKLAWTTSSPIRNWASGCLRLLAGPGRESRRLPEPKPGRSQTRRRPDAGAPTSRCGRRSTWRSTSSSGISREEARGQVPAAAAVQAAAPRAGHVEALAGTGDADVKEAALLLDVALLDRARVREDPLLAADHEDGLVLEALRGVQAHQRHQALRRP